MQTRKFPLTLLIIAILAIGISTEAFSQAFPLTKKEVDTTIDRMIAYTIAVAKAMPEEHYGYKAAEEIRSFGESLIHLIQSNYNTAGMIFGKQPEGTKPRLNSKEQIIKEMERSFAFFKNTLASTSDQELKGEVRDLARARWALYWIDHLTHTRGQLTILLRAKGIVPPKFSSWWY